MFLPILTALFVCTASLLTAKADVPLLTSECDTLSLIEGVVNIKNGNLVEISRDIHIESAASPLSLYRYYDGGHNYIGDYGYSVGVSVPLHLDYYPAKKVIHLEQRSGSHLSLEVEDLLRDPDWKYKASISKNFFSASGYCNCCESLLRGEPDIRSIRAYGRNSTFLIVLGNGTKRYYEKYKKMHHADRTVIKMRLVKEALPEGNVRHYKYVNTWSPTLESIKTKNSAGNVLINSIHFQHNDQYILLTGSNQQTAYYWLSEQEGELKSGKIFTNNKEVRRNLLHQIAYNYRPAITYDFVKKGHSLNTLFTIKTIAGPKGQQLKTKLDDRGLVKELYVGGNEKPRYSFTYHTNYSNVVNALGGRSRYDYFGGRLASVKEDHRTHTYNWSYRGLLESQQLQDGKGSTIINRDYSYNDAGFITQVQLTGKITNKDSCDNYAVAYTYSIDGYNLLLSESHNNQRKIDYAYLHGTNLLNKKLSSVGGRGYKREFSAYDDNRILIGRSFDDGSSPNPGEMKDVTCCLYTKIIPYSCEGNASMTLPYRVMDYYINPTTLEQKLLRASEFYYTARGLVAEEKVFDADNVYRYSRHYEYSHLDQVIREVNPLGEETIYQYDQVGNKIFQEKKGSGKRCRYSYDSSNNLIEEVEEHDDGTRFITHHSYDLMGNRIATIDPYGGKTRYEYDTASRQIAVIDPMGYRTSKAYDSQDHVIGQADEEGYLTETLCNIHGEPLLINYPDGTSKSYMYNLDGHLIQERERDGTYKSYQVDEEGNPTLIHFHNSEGHVLRAMSNRYKGGRLQESIDPMGVSTHYIYDLAGRLVEKRCGEKSIHYSYDSLGRLHATRADERVEIKEYDLLDRVVEERTEDIHGNLYTKKCYGYDINGNVVTSKVYSDQESYSETTTSYNSQNLPVQIVDPEGNRTTISYRHTDHLEKETVDPLGRRILEVFDRRQKLTSLSRFDSSGQLLAKSSYIYDGRGHCIAQEESRCHKGKVLDSYNIARKFNSMGCKETESEQGRRITSYYYQHGKLATITQPDGTVLFHTYDPLGRLETLCSSDPTIDYRYCYDANDNLLSIEEGTTQRRTERRYDCYNRLVHERQANGLEADYSYDPHDRLVKATFDELSLVYRHDAVYMRGVDRYGENGLQYSYTQEVDLRGKLLQATLPFGVSVSYSWDRIGRCTGITSSSYRQSNEYDAVGNLIAAHCHDSMGSTSNSYRYDSLDQLEEEMGSFTNSYQHDSLNNRLSVNGISQKVDNLNQLIDDGQNDYFYDHNGMPKYSGSATYKYDGLNRLVYFNDGSNTFRYSYDPFGRRMSQQRNEESPTYYRYFFDTEVAAYRDGKREEFRLLYRQHAHCAVELGDTAYSVIRNQRGDTCQLLNQQGEVVSGYRYDAFGNFISHGKTASPWLYSGQRYEANSGLYHFLKRYYDPGVGRWLTPDPLRFADGPNLYAYVHNNPLTHSDLYGLFDYKNQVWTGESKRENSDSDISFNPLKFFANERFQGSVQALGGLSEATIGGLVILGSEGTASFIGLPVMVHGLDQFFTGVDRIVTGEHRNTLTQHALQAAGMSQDSAFYIDNLLSATGSIGGTALIQTARTASFPNFYINRPPNNPSTRSENPLHNTKYTKKVLVQMERNLKTGKTDFHGFPRIVDRYAGLGKRELIKGRDGVERTKVILEGSYEGYNGHFEWIIEPNGAVNHRLFIPKS